MLPHDTQPQDDPLLEFELAADADVLRGDLEYERIKAASASLLFGTATHPQPTIGRYSLGKKLGSGGMGEVYRCWDPELERQVAVKVVRGEASEQAEQRLRREAIALGKLSHPNVIQIHEIGRDHDRLFIAMELVEGGTLSDWLERQPRSPTEVLEVFIAAGRGLAAAHAQGIVHRDFKPDNVLLGNDGRVRVADFGLAFSLETGLDIENTLQGSEGSDARLTAEGVVAGTPRYMPLEQLQGGGVDARADQFAFCVALYEALWGQYPFVVDGGGDRASALDRGPIPPLTRKHLFQPIRRGLAPQAEHRWPQMLALLDALEHCRRRPRKVAVMLLGVAAVCVSLSFGWFMTRQPKECSGVMDELAGVWSPAQRDKVRSHINTLSEGHAEHSRDLVLGRLDDWAIQWTTERRSACDRLHEPGRSDTHEAAATYACLSRQLSAVGALVTTLADGDAEALANAVVATTELADPASCRDQLVLLGLPPIPAKSAATIEMIRTELARLTQMRLVLGGHATTKRLAELERAAVALGYAPLVAEVQAELAKSFEHNEPIRAASLYDEAIEIAEVQHHDRLAADLLIERAELSLHELGEREQAAVRIEWAEVAVARAGADADSQARLAFGRGRLAQREQDPTRAESYFEQALQLASQDTLERAIYLEALANTCMDEPDRSLRLRAESLELTRRLLGPKHPRVATRLYNFGTALTNLGRNGESYLHEAVEIWSESGEPRWLARAELQLAIVAIEHNSLDIAEHRAETAARLLAEVLPEANAEHGEPRQILAIVHGLRGDHERALVHGRASLEAFAAAKTSPTDPRVVQMRLAVANNLLALGRYDEARTELQPLLNVKAHSQLTAALGHLVLAEIAVRENQPESAASWLDHVTPLRAQLGEERLSYELLRALVEQRLGRLEQTEELRATRAESPGSDEMLDAWLSELEADAEERAALGFAPN